MQNRPAPIERFAPVRARSYLAHRNDPSEGRERFGGAAAGRVDAVPPLGQLFHELAAYGAARSGYKNSLQFFPRRLRLP